MVAIILTHGADSLENADLYKLHITFRLPIASARKNSELLQNSGVTFVVI